MMILFPDKSIAFGFSLFDIFSFFLKRKSMKNSVKTMAAFAVTLSLLPVLPAMAADKGTVGFGQLYTGTFDDSNLTDNYTVVLTEPSLLSLDIQSSDGLTSLNVYWIDSAGIPVHSTSGLYNRAILPFADSMDLEVGTYTIKVDKYGEEAGTYDISFFAEYEEVTPEPASEASEPMPEPSAEPEPTPEVSEPTPGPSAESETLTYTISVSAASGGTASGGNVYQSGSSVTLTATPSTGNVFIGWYENGSRVSTEATYRFTASSNRTLEARFKLPQTGVSVRHAPLLTALAILLLVPCGMLLRKRDET